MKLALLAGNRQFPLIFAQKAKQHDPDIEIVAICFEGETHVSIGELVTKTCWVKVGELGEIIAILKREGISQCVMAGQINPRRIFKTKHWDQEMHALIDDLSDFRPHTVFSKIIQRIEQEGVEFLPSTLYMESAMADEGVIAGPALTPKATDDLAFGLKVISGYRELDVGQTIVVKSKAVIAIEALEGTDATIRRGWRIARAGCAVLKFSKRNQDNRFDVPIVGIKTLKLLKRIQCSTLALEAAGVIILEKERFLQLAGQYGISVVGVAQ